MLLPWGMLPTECIRMKPPLVPWAALYAGVEREQMILSAFSLYMSLPVCPYSSYSPEAMMAAEEASLGSSGMSGALKSQ